jgi:ATP-binding cassette subfamily C exporter for protease/lipase
MKSNNNSPSELQQAFESVLPQLRRAFGFALVAGLLVLAPTIYMFQVYDRVVNSRNHMTLVMLTLVVVLALAVMEFIEWAKSETLREAGAVLDKRLAPRVFGAIFEGYSRGLSGPTVQPMNDWRTVREFVHSPVVGAVLESPVALVFMVLMFMLSPVLGWSAVAGAVLQLLLAWLNQRQTNPPLREANKASFSAQMYADGSLRNAEVIEAMGMLRNVHTRWLEKQREFLNLQALASDRAGLFQALTKLVQTIMGSLLLGLGAWLLLEAKLPGGAGMMIVGSVLGGRILAPLVQVVSQWRNVVNAREAWGRLSDLLAQLPQRPPSMPLPPPKGALSVESLLAGAPGGAANAPILKGLNFALRPGEVLAVVGPSASGKTTLARLLVGLWPAASGKVRLDGVDVHGWDKSELGPHVGYLSQGVELLEGTLGENIARFGEVLPAKLKAAAEAAGLQGFLATLPQGFDTPVGRDGARLSGGQRQRVALARALYGEPAFVVLDEPNSSLDEQGEAALIAAIRQLKQRGTTFVVMTHRTGVLAVADKMLVLQDGTQQAFGPRDDVMAALNKAAAQARQQLQALAAKRPGPAAQAQPAA